MHINVKFFLLIIFLTINFLNSKVFIFTTAFNHAEYIELQYKSLIYFFKDDFEYVVYNDAYLPNKEAAIEATCNKLNIKHIKVPQSIHNSNSKAASNFINEVGCIDAMRHTTVIRYVFETIGFNYNDIVVVLDSDVFLFKEFSIKEMIKDYGICGRILYHGTLTLTPAPDIAFFNMPLLPRAKAMIFEASILGNSFRDPFYLLQHYLYCFPEIKIKWLLNEHTADLNVYSDEKLLSMNFNLNDIEFIRKYMSMLNNLSIQRDDSAFIGKVWFNLSFGRAEGNVFEGRIKLLNEHINKIIKK